MDLFATTDVAASIRKAYDEFTHVLVNRGYTTIKPVLFREDGLGDVKPVYHWSHWNPSTNPQLERWRNGGGVLFDCYTVSDRAGPADVLVFVECPMTLERLERSTQHIGEYAVIPRPHTWRMHEQCLDLRTPAVEVLRPMWQAARGRRLTDDELARTAGLTRTQVTYMRKSLRASKEWILKPRLAPEKAALLPAWAWVGSGRTTLRREVTLSGHKTAIKEMARLGHIALEKVHYYPAGEPDWTKLERERKAAKEGLAQIQFLLESLPDHLPGG